MIIHVTLKFKKTNKVVENRLAVRLDKTENKHLVAMEMLNYFANEHNIQPKLLKYEIE